MVLEKTLESPLDRMELKSVNPKGNQSWIFIGRSDAEAEAPILWPSDAKNWLICKDPDAGKDWRQEEKGTAEDEMVGWHHWLDNHEFKQAPGVLDSEAWHVAVHGVAESRTWLSDWTELLNWTELKKKLCSQRNEVLNTINESHCSSERKVWDHLFSFLLLQRLRLCCATAQNIGSHSKSSFKICSYVVEIKKFTCFVKQQ